MKNHIIQLIKDDIKITTLIQSLENLNISAPDYYLCNSTVIFDLMQIPHTEEMQDRYNKLIESVEVRLLNVAGELDKFTQKTYNDLLEFVDSQHSPFGGG